MLLCPCGSNTEYEQCCLLTINGDKAADSPEQLMRSRYTAYANNKISYIYETYAAATRKHQSHDELKIAANACKWVKLTVNNCNSISEPPTVEFSAYYIEKKTLYKMTENSRFVKEASVTSSPIVQKNWFYLDGDIIEHVAIAKLSPNDICPCYYNEISKKPKKYKKCCG